MCFVGLFLLCISPFWMWYTWANDKWPETDIHQQSLLSFSHWTLVSFVVNMVISATFCVIYSTVARVQPGEFDVKSWERRKTFQNVENFLHMLVWLFQAVWGWFGVYWLCNMHKQYTTWFYASMIMMVICLLLMGLVAYLIIVVTLLACCCGICLPSEEHTGKAGGKRRVDKVFHRTASMFLGNDRWQNAQHKQLKKGKDSNMVQLHE